VAIMGAGLRPIGKPLEQATVPCDRAARHLSIPTVEKEADVGVIEANMLFPGGAAW
jgi:hypothetical protein